MEYEPFIAQIVFPVAFVDLNLHHRRHRLERSVKVKLEDVFKQFRCTSERVCGEDCIGERQGQEGVNRSAKRKERTMVRAVIVETVIVEEGMRVQVIVLCRSSGRIRKKKKKG